ncbi:hypothetical protein OF83DRAFT_1169157 [Amylostereum chailletii]|nr:hypothetical protein OF83DRAFT_1169157 [Amylostereum chailletii]
MPVPVPTHLKATAHQVIKPNIQSGVPTGPHLPTFHTLNNPFPARQGNSLPTTASPLHILPSWRHNKPLRIWEEDRHIPDNSAVQAFSIGLTDAENVSVIKGQRAQAYIPPTQTFPTMMDRGHSLATFVDGEDDDDEEMDSSFEYDLESQWSGHSQDAEDGAHMDVDYDPLVYDRRSDGHRAGLQEEHIYERGAFTPVFEDSSPERDDNGEPGSSPLGPLTPFGEYVDRAVATAGEDRRCGDGYSYHQSASLGYDSKYNVQAVQPVVDYPVDYTRVDDPATALDPSLPPSTLAYKKIADPLADWMASYVWKACTTGMSLPHSYVPQSTRFSRQYPHLPPSYLANSIRSLFMSTLLQPSAIVLAVWYIVRLPICFGPTDLGPEQAKEIRFRTELLGLNEWSGLEERRSMEMQAPFRLVLLGCMLANKWLDDHTFSNKTWHTISGVPIQSLNRLESLALDLFVYDLSVPPSHWARWLEHVVSYHSCHTMTTHPQPISRPSSNPHSIMRRTLEQLVEVSAMGMAPRPCGLSDCPQLHPEPVFLGADDRKAGEECQYMHAGMFSVDVSEIDLDEDGPLREEYMPKRRTGRGHSRDNVPSYTEDWERPMESERSLPPPARWSPAGDEPLQRHGSRGQGQYVAVQPSAAPPAPMIERSAPHAPSYGFWGSSASAMSDQVKLPLPPIYPSTAFSRNQPAAHTHTRSLSHGYGQADSHYGHGRSQSQFEYACSSMRMTAPKAPYNPSDLHWRLRNMYAYGQPYGPTSEHVQFQAPWVQA